MEAKGRNHITGKKGEELAVQHLKKAGIKILALNYRHSRWGEIDIIAQEKDTLIFCEVKTRTTTNYGHPLESISRHKIGQIHKTALSYLSENPSLKYKGMRFDAVAVILGREGKPEIVHYKDVFQF